MEELVIDSFVEGKVHAMGIDGLTSKLLLSVSEKANEDGKTDHV